MSRVSTHGTKACFHDSRTPEPSVGTKLLFRPAHDTRPYAQTQSAARRPVATTARPWARAPWPAARASPAKAPTQAAGKTLAPARARSRGAGHYLRLAQREGRAGESGAQVPSRNRHRERRA